MWQQLWRTWIRISAAGAVLGLATYPAFTGLSAPPVAGNAEPANAGPPTLDCNNRRSLPKAEADELLIQWYSRVLDVHPQPFARVSAQVLEDAVSARRAMLPTEVPMPILQAQTAELAALLRDTHTGVRSNDPDANWLYLPLAVNNGELCFTRSWSDVPAGSCVEAIAGVDTATVLQWTRPLVSAETAVGIDVNLVGYLTLALTVHGYAPPLDLDLVEPTGRRHMRSLPRQDGPDTRRRVLEVEWLTPEIAMLTVNSFLGTFMDQFRSTLPRMFEQLALDGVKGMIVDIRDNSGGDTRLAELLLHYLTDKPFRITSEKRWRVSHPVQEQLLQSGTTCDYTQATPGSYLDTEPTAVTYAPPANRFTGPFAMLVGPGTQSAALMLADAVKTYRLGALVGTPLASNGNFFGEVYSFPLGCSPLVATISTAQFTRTDGNPYDDSPLRPHVIVHENAPPGRPSERAIEAAVALLNHRIQTRPGEPFAPDPASEVDVTRPVRNVLRPQDAAFARR